MKKHGDFIKVIMRYIIWNTCLNNIVTMLIISFNSTYSIHKFIDFEKKADKPCISNFKKR